MSYAYNNGWGGCGCGNTVQYAPPACNPNFPTACTALGAGNIQRVVGEDSSYCKYTVPTLSSNSILFYNASNGLVKWADGSIANPIYLGSGNQATSTIVGAIQGTTPTGQLVEFNPNTSTEAQFPVVAPSGTTTTWGTIESIVPNTGLVYRNNTGTVSQLTGTSGQYVSFDSNGNAVAVAPTISNGYTSVSGAYNATSGQRLATNTSSGSFIVTLPSSPSNGAVVTIADGAYSWSQNNLTISPASGSTIQGSVQNLICNVSNWQITFYFNGTTWIIIIG
jgi:hypothetical protein